MQGNEFVTLAVVQEAINILRGAVTIVYPMGLPPHDPIRCEFENTEDLSGTQVSNDYRIKSYSNDFVNVPLIDTNLLAKICLADCNCFNIS